MLFDYSALRGLIVEKFGTCREFAKECGIPRTSLSMKLNNKLSWKQCEIERARVVLGINENDISRFFFCSRSSKY